MNRGEAEKVLSDLRKTEALRIGDRCEFRYPARLEWRAGYVRLNGGSGYWQVWDNDAETLVCGLYIEHVRAPGTMPWDS